VRHSAIAFAGLLAFFLTAVPAADSEDEKRYQRYVDQLGSEDFNERQAAEQALLAAGDESLSMIEETLNTGARNPEVRHRASRILQKILRAHKLRRFMRDFQSSDWRIVRKSIDTLMQDHEFAANAVEYLRNSPASKKEREWSKLADIITWYLDGYNNLHEKCRKRGLNEVPSSLTKVGNELLLDRMKRHVDLRIVAME
jgi:hypothetical protein